MAVAQQDTQSKLTDIEDLCTFCEDLPEFETGPDMGTEKLESRQTTPSAPKKQMKQTTLFGLVSQSATNKYNNEPPQSSKPGSSQTMSTAQKYAQQFPRKVVKQSVRVEVRLVCIMRLHTSSQEKTGEQDEENGTLLYLVVQRPDKGLLASLWEFPTLVLDSVPEDMTEETLLSKASTFVQELNIPFWRDGTSSTGCTIERPDSARLLGRVKHKFSHLEWDMHVCLIDVHAREVRCFHALNPSNAMPEGQWLSSGRVEGLTMGTGLRRCWSLVPSNK